MKLFYSPTSPYVRKVMVVALASGCRAQISLVSANPHACPPDLVSMNPLSKVPCLVTDDGTALFDSPVICEYLDAVADGGLFPVGAARWRALKLQAVGDGILDAALIVRTEQGRAAEPDRLAVMTKQRHVMVRALDMLEADVPADHLDIGTLTVACALGYLDLRFAGEPWRPGRAKLMGWYEKMAARPEMIESAPPPA